MSVKKAKANVEPVRQRTQYSCMSASMAMCLNALDHDVDEDEVNRVMGSRPMKGAAWEDALACAQHYGCRATLTTPSTVNQLKTWTDAGVPVMIAWNPEGREWSHASVVYHVTEGPIETIDESQIIQGEGPGLYVFVADPNIPHPDKTTRIVHEDIFYSKWYEKWPNYLVRRPACAIDREVTPAGRQVMASKKLAGNREDFPQFYDELDRVAGHGDGKNVSRLNSKKVKDQIAEYAQALGDADAKIPDWLLILGRMEGVDTRKIHQLAMDVGVWKGALESYLQGNGERQDPSADLTEMTAYDMGYEEMQLPDWMLGLGNHYRVDVKKYHRDGLRDAKRNRQDRYASAARVAERALTAGSYKRLDPQRWDRRYKKNYADDVGWYYEPLNRSDKTDMVLLAIAMRLAGKKSLPKPLLRLYHSRSSQDVKQGMLDAWRDLEGRYLSTMKKIPLYPAGARMDIPKGFPTNALEAQVLSDKEQAWVEENFEFDQVDPNWVKLYGKSKGTPKADSGGSDNTKERLEVLDQLLAKRPDRFIQSLRNQIAQGKTLTDNQLKALRRNLYQNRMRGEADLFRMARKKKTQPARRLGPGAALLKRRPGAGPHHTREQDVESGRSRKPKHKRDLRRDHAASAGRVAARYLGEDDA